MWKKSKVYSASLWLYIYITMLCKMYNISIKEEEDASI